VTPKEATAAVIDGLNSLGIPYMLVGSLSSNLYGVPRSTQDADFVVQLKAGAVLKLVERLGPSFRFDPQMGFETITGTHRYVLRLIDSPFSVELFLLGDDAHDLARFARRRLVRALDRDVLMPTMEDVILTKLRWYHVGQRPKDLDDAVNVISVQGDRIDWDYVYSWCDRHGTRELLDSVRQSLPPE
jgi:hypothetical protein